MNCETCGLPVKYENVEKHRHDCLVWRAAILAGADEYVLGDLFWKAIKSTERINAA